MVAGEGHQIERLLGEEGGREKIGWRSAWWGFIDWSVLLYSCRWMKGTEKPTKESGQGLLCI